MDSRVQIWGFIVSRQRQHRVYTRPEYPPEPRGARPPKTHGPGGSKSLSNIGIATRVT